MTAINFPISPSPGDKHPITGSIDGKVWAWDGTTWKIVSTNGTVNLTVVDDTSHDHDWIDLDDTPSSYSGQAGKFTKVNANEDGLEFTTAPTGGSTYNAFAGVDAGLVPASILSETNYYLRSDGNWATPTDTTYSSFNNTVAGLVPASGVSSGPTTYSINVTNSGSGAYTFSGTDRNGSVSGNNPTINVNEGDTINFAVNASGHPFLVKTVSGTGTGNQLANFVNGVDYTGGGVSGNGTASGTVTLYTSALGGTTLYYNCQYHSSMAGSIVIGVASSTNKYLRADGTWVVPPDTDTGEDNVQADWTEQNGTSDAFIRNKPSGTLLTTSSKLNDLDDVNIPTNASLIDVGKILKWDGSNFVIGSDDLGTGGGSLNIKYLQDTGSANNNYISYFTGVQGSYANYQFDTNYPSGFQSQSWNNWGGWINPWNAGGQQGDGLLFFTLSDNSETTWSLKLHSTSPNTSLTSGNQCRCWTSTDGVNWVYQGANNTISTTTTISITTAYLIVTDLGMGSGSEVYLEVGSSSVGGTNYLSKTELSVTQVGNSGTGTLTYDNGGTLTYTPPLVPTIPGAATSSSAGLVPQLPAGTFSDRFLREDNTWVTPPDTDTTYNNFTGGVSGLVPAPLANGNNDANFLKGDGTWGTPSDTNTTYSNFTSSSAGLVPISPQWSTTKYLRGDGTWVVPPDTDTDTTYSNFTSSVAGLVPASGGGTTKYLRADGTWQTVSGSADGNDYVNNLSLSGTTLTASFSNASLNQTVDLASINTDTNTTYSVVSTSANGLAPILPSSHGGKYLKADGTWQLPPDTNTDTTYSNFNSSAAGLTPASGGGTTKYLRADGTWTVPPDTDTDTNTTYNTFTGGTEGLVPNGTSAGSDKYLRSDGTWQTVTSGGGADGNDYVTNLSLSGTTLTASFGNTSLNQTVNLASINTDTNTTYSVVSNSANGLAPQLPASSTGKYLKDDGTWQTPPDTNTDTNTNYYANSFSFNNSSNVLSIGYAGNSSLNTTVTINPSSSGGGDIPSGSVMLFAQSSAPTGWTKSTSHNNKALRVVSGNGGGSGGSVGFTSAFQNHNVSISGSDTVSVSISGDCTGSQVMYRNTTQAFLTTDQMPSHQHDYDVPRGTTGSSYGFQDTATGTSSGLQKVASTGGSNYHTHAIIMYYIEGSNFSFSGSGSDTVSISGSDSVNTAVQYVDVIICTKS